MPGFILPDGHASGSVPIKFVGNVTIGALATSMSFTHGLGTTDIVWNLYATGTVTDVSALMVTVTITSTTIAFTMLSSALAAGTYRCVCVG